MTRPTSPAPSPPSLVEALSACLLGGLLLGYDLVMADMVDPSLRGAAYVSEVLGRAFGLSPPANGGWVAIPALVLIAWGVTRLARYLLWGGRSKHLQKVNRG